MIQRIQSLFLLLAAAAAFSLLALPFGTINGDAGQSAFFSDKVFNIHDNPAMLGLFCLAGALAFINIFLFKNRKTQLLVGRLAIVANIIGAVLAVFLFMQDSQALGDKMPDEEIGLGMPILFLIFGFLALRYINKDDKLVKSMDRLR